MAGEVGGKANVDTLVLTRPLPVRDLGEIYDRARTVYDVELYVAEDGLGIEILSRAVIRPKSGDSGPSF